MILFLGFWLYLTAGGLGPDINGWALLVAAIFSLAAYAFIFHIPNQAEEWKLQLPLPPGALLTQQLVAALLRISAAAIVAAAIGVYAMHQPLAKIAAPILTVTFATLCFRLLSRFPTAHWSLFPALHKQHFLTGLLFVAPILLTWSVFKGPPPYGLPIFAALYGGLVWLIYRRLPVAFLLAPDDAVQRESQAPATQSSVSRPNRFRFWLRYVQCTQLWFGIVIAGYFGCTLLFWGPGGMLLPSALFGLGLYRSQINNALIMHLPLSRRSLFALQAGPFLLFILACALGPLLLFPNHKPTYGDWVESPQFRFTKSADDRDRYLLGLWPLAGRLVSCQEVYVHDLALVREGLRDCYGFDPAMDLEPYLERSRMIIRVEWKTFWQQHPEVPLRFAYRLADIGLMMAGIFAMFLAGIALRIGEQSSYRLFDIVRKYPNVIRWAIVFLSIAPLSNWDRIGEFHATYAAEGARYVGIPIKATIAAMLPTNHSHAVGVLLAACAVLYLLLQELDARCDVS